MVWLVSEECSFKKKISHQSLIWGFFFFKLWGFPIPLACLWVSAKSKWRVWCPGYHKLWINSLCLFHLGNLHLLPVFLVAPPRYGLHHSLLVTSDYSLQSGVAPTVAYLCLAVLGFGSYLCALCVECLGYLFSVWYSAFVIGSHLFGIFDIISSFFCILFAVFCVTVLCCTV